MDKNIEGKPGRSTSEKRVISNNKWLSSLISRQTWTSVKYYPLIFLAILLRIRFVFKKPLHNNILLYDGISKNKMDLISKKYAVFYNRYEEINLYVLFYTIFTNGLKDIKKNYKVNFFKFIFPKCYGTPEFSYILRLEKFREARQRGSWERQGP